MYFTCFRNFHVFSVVCMITEKPQMNGENGRTYVVSTKSIFVIILKTVAYTNVLYVFPYRRVKMFKNQFTDISGCRNSWNIYFFFFKVLIFTGTPLWIVSIQSINYNEIKRIKSRGKISGPVLKCCWQYSIVFITVTTETTGLYVYVRKTIVVTRVFMTLKNYKSLNANKLSSLISLSTINIHKHTNTRKRTRACLRVCLNLVL